MLKKRLIPKFLLRDGRLVKYTRFFHNERIAGNPVTTAKVYNDYGVDELIVLDIVPSEQSQGRVVEIIERMSEEIFMPFTVGGGVRTLEDVNRLLRAGADKVSVNSEAVRRPKFVREAARTFGDQCITVSIDYMRTASDGPRVFIDGGHERTALDPIEWALRCEDLHCGEILLGSIDRDGTMEGYDLDLIHEAADRLSVPLIVSGGCGSLQHAIDALEAGASAVAISSMFLFTDHSPIKLRSHLASRGLDVRTSASSRN
ncbi:MAG TPA: imidazole glycerol phosphate synthase cyclase subunit [Pirellulales bacterium]|jgi:cyclase|nr:imidazole glycerol phosphate synthase cyclase subunit [Pirellulales bacterium]